ncbi:4-hydroxy-3-methylbut-2-enyl diphosphate reductase, partial [bacterium]
KKAQDLVSMLAKEGYAVIVVGEKDHPEVMGLVSYSPADILVVESPEELKNMPRRKKIGIVAQTTVPMERLEAVVKFCVSRASEIKVFNTICNATSIRQEETADLAGKVGVMIIVGGRNSANTRRLAEICRTVLPKNTHHVETADELELSWFNGVKSAGITSGASTPDWIINGVVEKIKSFTGEGIRASSML